MADGHHRRRRATGRTAAGDCPPVGRRPPAPCGPEDDEGPINAAAIARTVAPVKKIVASSIGRTRPRCASAARWRAGSRRRCRRSRRRRSGGSSSPRTCCQSVATARSPSRSRRDTRASARAGRAPRLGEARRSSLPVAPWDLVDDHHTAAAPCRAPAARPRTPAVVRPVTAAPAHAARRRPPTSSPSRACGTANASRLLHVADARATRRRPRAGATFSPPRLMISFRRPVIVR